MIQTLVEAAGEGREAEVDWGGWPSPLHVGHRFEGAPHSCLSVPAARRFLRTPLQSNT